MKVLMLYSGNDSFNEMFRKERNENKKCYSQPLYSSKIKHNFLFKFIQFLGVYIFNPLLFFIYGEWKNNINNYDLFIIPSRKPAIYAAKIIKKKTNKRIIIWYWNAVTKKEINPYKCQKKGYETWSFDIDDCKKYNMKFGDQYFFNFSDIECNNAISKVDLFYIGKNKGERLTFINKLKKYLNDNNITYNINLCNSSNKNKNSFSVKMDYEEVIQNIKLSKSILDLNIKEQSGLTMRPLEALYFNKKLITNNNKIIDYYAYEKENTLIIENDNFDEIKTFLSKPTKKISNEKLNYYKFDSWLERIINNEEGYYKK